MANLNPAAPVPAPKPADSPPEVRGILQFFSALVGLVCLVDTAREGFSAGGWHSYTGIYQAYYYILAAYAPAREWKKWTEPQRQEGTWMGEFFLSAWIGLVILFYELDAHHYDVIYPSTLNPTLKVVLGVYFITGLSKGLRATGLTLRGLGGGTPKPPASPTMEAVIRSAKKLVDFTAQQLADDARLSLEAAAACLGPLVRMGLVVKDAQGRFHWVGPK